MTEQDYKELNNYLNMCFLELEKDDNFFIDNLMSFGVCSEVVLREMNADEKEEKNYGKTLTFEEVINLSRQVIASIDTKYLKDFDEIDSKGHLEFIDDEKNKNSFFESFNDGNWGINIVRDYDIRDVRKLVHEFFHKTNENMEGENTKIRYILTEFISIYFETYAMDFLKNNLNYPEEELDYNTRLYWLKIYADNIWITVTTLLAYNSFGNINQESSKLVRNYMFEISDADFEKENLRLLKRFKKLEKECEIENFPDVYSNDDLVHHFKRCFLGDYRYFLGVLLAYYARENCEVKDIVWLNDNLQRTDLNVSEILNKIGIDLQNGEEIAKAVIKMIKGDEKCKE